MSSTETKGLRDIVTGIKYHEEIFDYIRKNNDDSLLDELKNEVQLTLKLSEKIRYLNLLNDEADHLNAFIEIHAGAGGTESQDWAEIFQRMYSGSQAENRLIGAFGKLFNSTNEIVYQTKIEGYTMANAPFKDYPRSFNRQTLIQTFGSGGSAPNRVKKIRLYKDGYYGADYRQFGISMMKFYDKNGINVSDINKTLKEAFRVLRPGGRFMCLEFSKIDNDAISFLYKQYSRLIPLAGKFIESKNIANVLILVNFAVVRSFPTDILLTSKRIAETVNKTLLTRKTGLAV